MRSMRGVALFLLCACSSAAVMSADHPVINKIVGLLPNGGVTPTPPAPITIQWVTVGSPGNPADTEVMAEDRTTAHGRVDYTYRISKYPITNAQYAAFLNAVASKVDLYLLYVPLMDRSYLYGAGSGIIRTGLPGSYVYVVEPGREKYPVNYINLYDAMRFANWVNNGQGNADTETGAYTLQGGTPIPTNLLTLHRNPDAKVFLPSDDEWYKAAFYDPVKHVYYDSPYGTNTPVVCAMPGSTPNTANCGLVTAANNPSNPGLTGVASWFYGHVTPVDAYPNSKSPFGVFDMGGNVFQWTQDLTLALQNDYHVGSMIAPVQDQVHSIIGNPWQTWPGFGPCAIVRSVDYGDGGEYSAANGRSCDQSFFKWETYGIRLASRP